MGYAYLFYRRNPIALVRSISTKKGMRYGAASTTSRNPIALVRSISTGYRLYWKDGKDGKEVAIPSL